MRTPYRCDGWRSSAPDPAWPPPPVLLQRSTDVDRWAWPEGHRRRSRPSPVRSSCSWPGRVAGRRRRGCVAPRDGGHARRGPRGGRASKGARGHVARSAQPLPPAPSAHERLPAQPGDRRRALCAGLRRATPPAQRRVPRWGSTPVVTDPWFASSEAGHPIAAVQDLGWSEHRTRNGFGSSRRRDDNAVNLARLGRSLRPAETREREAGGRRADRSREGCSISGCTDAHSPAVAGTARSQRGGRLRPRPTAG